jgi:DNA-binding NtrC family response regulator
MPIGSLRRSPPGSRVLIVDDEGRLRDMLMRSAAEMGFDPIPARSAEQALRLMDADAGGIDVVLLDLNLPGKGGLELLEDVRRRWPDTEVIILTGFGNLEAAKRAIRLDAADFLTKPCSLEELEAALSKARRRRLERLQPAMPSETGDAGGAPDATSDAGDGPQPMTLEDVERVHILAALDRHGGNRAAAAAELGISERTLYYRLGQYQQRQRREP